MPFFVIELSGKWQILLRGPSVNIYGAQEVSTIAFFSLDIYGLKTAPLHIKDNQTCPLEPAVNFVFCLLVWNITLLPYSAAQSNPDSLFNSIE